MNQEGCFTSQNASARPDPSEYRRAFTDHASRARTYIVRSVVVLTLLLVVVEDRLRVTKREALRLIDEVHIINQSLSSASALVRKEREEARRRLHELHALAALPAPSAQLRRMLRRPPPDLKRSRRVQHRIDTEVHRLRQAARTLKATSGAALNELASDIESSRWEAARRRVAYRAAVARLRLPDQAFVDEFPEKPDVWDGAEERDRLTQTQAAAQGLRLLTKEKRLQGELASEVNLLAADLEDYSRTYRDQSRTWRVQNAEKARKLATYEAVISKSSTLPTPFGGFDVFPQLALAGLSFATFGCYLGLHASIRRVRTTAYRFREDYGTQASICLDRPAPAWLCTADRALDDAFGWSTWKRRLAISVLFHVAWLSALALLVWECHNWSAGRAVLFAPPFATQLATALTLPIGIIVAAQFFLSGVPRRPAADLSRRRVTRLAFAATLIALVGGVAVLSYRLRGIGPSRAARQSRMFGVTAGEARRHLGEEFAQLFVANRRTGVVHSRGEASNHTGRFVSIREVPEEELRDYSVHRGSQILAAAAASNLARPASASGSAEVGPALDMLAAAVLGSPGSVHLFDRYASICGRTKQYQRIDRLVHDVNALVSKAMETNAIGQADGRGLIAQYQARRGAMRRRMEKAAARRQV